MLCLGMYEDPPAERRERVPADTVAEIRAATNKGRTRRAKAPAHRTRAGHKRQTPDHQPSGTPDSGRAEARGGTRPPQDEKDTTTAQRQRTTPPGGGGQAEAGPRPHAPTRSRHSDLFILSNMDTTVKSALEPVRLYPFQDCRHLASLRGRRRSGRPERRAVPLNDRQTRDKAPGHSSRSPARFDSRSSDSRACQVTPSRSSTTERTSLASRPTGGEASRTHELYSFRDAEGTGLSPSSGSMYGHGRCLLDLYHGQE